MTTSADDKVLQYLAELHALEAGLVSTITSHLAMTPPSAYRDLLERHRYETRTQVQRLERRLGELGQTATLLDVAYGAAQAVVGQGVALAMAPLSLVRGTSSPEKLLKNAKDEAASEALEIASYDALETVAEVAGDTTTATLAREHRAQEERFLAELRAAIGVLALDVVGAEAPAQAAATTSTVDQAAADPSGDAAATSDTTGAQPPTAADDGGETELPGAGDLPVDGYDELTVEQLLPKLKTLSAEELAAVDGHERGGKARKRVLDRVAALRTKLVEQQLAAL